MSIQIMTLVWELDLPDSEKLALLALADNANDEGLCWPSMATLVRKCSKSDRTVQRSIQSLEQKGHLTREERPGKGVLYHIHPRHGVTPDKMTPPSPGRSTPDTVSDKPSRTSNTPQTPRAGSDERDPGDEHWRIPQGRSWKETGAMLRKLGGNQNRKSRGEQPANGKPLSTAKAAPTIRHPVRAKSNEDARSAEVHGMLRKLLGEKKYGHWLSNVAILVEPDGLTVVAGTSFESEWIKENLSSSLQRLAANVAGITSGDLRFEVESKSVLRGPRGQSSAGADHAFAV